MDRNDGVDDPHASALLGDSTYERIRMQRDSLFKQSIPTKLAWQAVILGALALVVPLAMAQPEATRTLFGGDPLRAAPKFLFLGMYASAIEFVATLGLCYVAARRIAAEESLDEREVRDLLAVEDVASTVSLVTGGAAVAAVHAFFLIGLGGDPVVDHVVSVAGRNPFTEGFIPVTVTLVAASATVLAALSFALSRVFAGRMPPN